MRPPSRQRRRQPWRQPQPQPADEQGYTLQTVIIITILVIGAVITSVLLYAILRDGSDNIARGTENYDGSPYGAQNLRVTNAALSDDNTEIFFEVAWDAPSFTGGGEVRSYSFEIVETDPDTDQTRTFAPAQLEPMEAGDPAPPLCDFDRNRADAGAGFSLSNSCRARITVPAGSVDDALFNPNRRYELLFSTSFDDGDGRTIFVPLRLGNVAQQVGSDQLQVTWERDNDRIFLELDAPGENNNLLHDRLHRVTLQEVNADPIRGNQIIAWGCFRADMGVQNLSWVVSVGAEPKVFPPSEASASDSNEIVANAVIAQAFNGESIFFPDPAKRYEIEIISVIDPTGLDFFARDCFDECADDDGDKEDTARVGPPALSIDGIDDNCQVSGLTGGCTGDHAFKEPDEDICRRLMFDLGSAVSFGIAPGTPPAPTFSLTTVNPSSGSSGVALPQVTLTSNGCGADVDTSPDATFTFYWYRASTPHEIDRFATADCQFDLPLGLPRGDDSNYVIWATAANAVGAGSPSLPQLWVRTTGTGPAESVTNVQARWQVSSQAAELFDANWRRNIEYRASVVWDPPDLDAGRSLVGYNFQAEFVSAADIPRGLIGDEVQPVNPDGNDADDDPNRPLTPADVNCQSHLEPPSSLGAQTTQVDLPTRLELVEELTLTLNSFPVLCVRVAPLIANPTAGDNSDSDSLGRVAEGQAEIMKFLPPMVSFSYADIEGHRATAAWQLPDSSHISRFQVFEHNDPGCAGAMDSTEVNAQSAAGTPSDAVFVHTFDLDEHSFYYFCIDAHYTDGTTQRLYDSHPLATMPEVDSSSDWIPPDYTDAIPTLTLEVDFAGIGTDPAQIAGQASIPFYLCLNDNIIFEAGGMEITDGDTASGDDWNRLRGRARYILLGDTLSGTGDVFFVPGGNMGGFTVRFNLLGDDTAPDLSKLDRMNGGITIPNVIVRGNSQPGVLQAIRYELRVWTSADFRCLENFTGVTPVYTRAAAPPPP